MPFVKPSLPRLARRVAPSIVATMLAAAASTWGIATAQAAQSIDSYAWKNRILIVFSGNAQSRELAEQRRIIHDAGDAFDARGLHVVEVIGDQVDGASDSARTLRKHYDIGADSFKVLLIGKDTGVKIASATPISAQTLTGTIDAMPMRRDEVQAR